MNDIFLLGLGNGKYGIKVESPEKIAFQGRYLSQQSFLPPFFNYFKQSFREVAAEAVCRFQSGKNVKLLLFVQLT